MYNKYICTYTHYIQVQTAPCKHLSLFFVQQNKTDTTYLSEY